MDIQAEKTGEQSLAGLFFDVAKIVALAIVIAMGVRIFLFQPFNIPSGSMKSTLLVGDYLFVSKYSYGYSRYSLPFSFKLFEGRILAGEPARGDIAVFNVNDVDYIKRVIGLPGDRIQMDKGRLVLNGKAVERTRVEPFREEGALGRQREIVRYHETLPNGPGYMTLDLHVGSDGDDTREFTVPAGHYFMLGDNRDNSSDSRFNSPIGFVPAEKLIGKAQFLYFSHNSMASAGNLWDRLGAVRWQRILKSVR